MNHAKEVKAGMCITRVNRLNLDVMLTCEGHMQRTTLWISVERDRKTKGLIHNKQTLAFDNCWRYIMWVSPVDESHNSNSPA